MNALATERPDHAPARLIKIREVMELTSLSRATIYRQIRAGNFPQQHKITPQRVGWFAHEIEAWQKNLSSAA